MRERALSFLNKLQDTSDSRRLVRALRHDDSLPMTTDGWVWLGDLRRRAQFQHFDSAYVQWIADTMEKKRLEVSSDGHYVRASSGHSVKIALDTILTPVMNASDVPYCAHGTTTAALPEIQAMGLHRMGRHYIHFAQHPDAVRRNSDVIIHLDVERFIRRNPGNLHWTSNGTIVALGNKSGFIRPTFFKHIEYLY